MRLTLNWDGIEKNLRNLSMSVPCVPRAHSSAPTEEGRELLVWWCGGLWRSILDYVGKKFLQATGKSVRLRC